MNELSSVNETLRYTIHDLTNRFDAQSRSMATSHSEQDMDNSSSNSDVVESLDNFMLQRHQKRKLSKKERKERRKEQHKRKQDTQTTAQTPVFAASTYAEAVKKPPARASSQPSSALTAAPEPTLQAAPSIPNAQSDICEIYIGGLDAKHSQRDVSDFIMTLGITGNVHVRILSTKGNWRSFCVKAPKYAECMLLDPTKWPQGIKLRLFRAPRQHSRPLSRRSQHSYPHRGAQLHHSRMPGLRYKHHGTQRRHNYHRDIASWGTGSTEHNQWRWE